MPVFLAPIGTPEPPGPPFFVPSGIPDPADLIAGGFEGLLAEDGSLLTPGPVGNLLTPGPEGSLLTDPVDDLVAAAADLVAVPIAGFFAAAGEGFGRALGAGAGKALGCGLGGALYIGRLKVRCPPPLVSPSPRGLLAVPILGPAAPV